MNPELRSSFRPNFVSAWLLAIAVLSGLWGCHSLSKAEREMCQQSKEALCTGVVKTYKTHDLKAFTDLAISRKELGAMMNGVKLPSTAKREPINNLSAGEFAKIAQDSLDKVLNQTDINWTKASFDKFLPTRNPVEIAEGYKMILGKLYIKEGEKLYSQAITIVEIGKGRFLMGDFSAILVEE
jgi:hypothetical protein